jgi:thymidylate kinase
VTGTLELAAPHPLLKRSFAVLDQAGVEWCVLRGEHELGRPQEDVDLLISASQRERALTALRAIGFERLPACGRGSHVFVRAYHGPTNLWVTLDLVTELSYGPAFSLATDAAAGCLRRRRRVGDLFLPAPDDAFWTLLLHCLLDKRAVEPRHAGRLEALAQEARPDGPLGAVVDSVAPRAAGAASMLEAARRRDWAALGASRPRLLRSWTRAQLARVAGRAARQRVLALGEKPTVWLSRRGLSVALLGPDGAGKSTLARELADGFCFPATSAYMGLWQGDADARSPLRAVLRALSRPAISLRRYLAARVHQERGRLVVFDRYTYDAHLPPRPPLVAAKRLYFWLLARTCPRPGLVLLLDAPGELLAGRKGEHTAEELEWQRSHFLRLRERIPRLEVVDATRPLDAVKADVVERVWREYGTRRGAGAR